MTAPLPTGIRIRLTTLRDVPGLLELDRLYGSSVLANQEALLRRLVATYPAGQHVAIATASGDVLGAICTQRIASSEAQQACAHDAKLGQHTACGPILQLIGIVQRQGVNVAGVLLRYVLLRCQLDGSIERLCAFCCCREFELSRLGKHDGFHSPAGVSSGMLCHTALGGRTQRFPPNDDLGCDTVGGSYDVLACYEFCTDTIHRASVGSEYHGQNLGHRADIDVNCAPLRHNLALFSLFGRWPAASTAAGILVIDGAAGDAAQQVPAARWHVLPSSTSAERHGAFIAAAQYFDVSFFAISPAEAHAMDPQQRLLLEIGYASFHGAGSRMAALHAANMGAFVGIMNADFAAFQTDDAFAVTGAALSIAAGRLSFALGMQGPCISYDTACSSSLVALQGALSSLTGHECDMAVTLAVSLMLAPHTHRVYSCAGMLSMGGRCKVFDALADGYARGEGVGAGILHRGRAAQDLRALGSCIRSDGRSASLMAPNGLAQTLLIRAALSEAGLQWLSALEAHGTGTPLGDPIETGALKRALNTAAGLCIGGMKANVCHAEPAAGLAGLFVLAKIEWQHSCGANAKLRVLNPLIVAPMYGVAARMPTQRTRLVDARAAGVSSLGCSGTIAHLVVGIRKPYYVVDEGSHVSRGFAAGRQPRLLFCQRQAILWREWLSSPGTDTLCLYSLGWMRCLLSIPPVSPITLLMICNSLERAHCGSRALAPDWSTSLLVLLAGSGEAGHSPCSTFFALALVQQVMCYTTLSRMLLVSRVAVAASSQYSSDAAHSGLWGFARVVRLEHAALGVKTIEATCSTVLAQECSVTKSSSEAEVVWHGDERFTMRLHVCASKLIHQRRHLHGLHAITGGLGGLGRRAATYLIEDDATGILLSSRSGHTVEPAIAALGGARVRVVAIDVSDPVATLSLLGCSALTSVLHAAAVLQDRMLRFMVFNDIGSVFAPKANAAARVHCVTLWAPLEALALFSSIVSTFGNVGQANYASANAYLDALAWVRRVGGKSGSSLQLAAVDGAGMGASASRNAQLSARGVISLDEFAKCLLAALAPARAAAERVQAVLALATPSVSTAHASGCTASISIPAMEVSSVLRILQDVTVNAEMPTADSPLMDAGVDSIAAGELATRLSALSGTPVSPTVMFEHPTARAIAYSLLQVASSSSSRVVLDPMRSATLDVGHLVTLRGLVSQWPGGCDGDSSRVRLQHACGDTVNRVPVMRWELFVDVLTPMQVACARYGGFIDAVQCFSSREYNISPAEAGTMDPHQRLLLAHGYKALHASSHNRATLIGSLTGVALGIQRSDWMFAAPPAARNSIFMVTGDDESVAAGRLSFVLGLHGQCSSIDTACSSSLSAMHIGEYALKNGECDMVLSSAVSLLLTPLGTLRQASASMLAIDGRCKTFDLRANGYTRSEAIGAQVLCASHLSSMLCCASTVRQDGRSASLTAPNGLAQRQLLVASIGRSALAPSEMANVEAHGTGTSLGDPIEAGALGATFCANVTPFVLGAVKASTGHAEAAAGYVGLCCTLQMMARQGGNAQLRAINPLVDQSLHMATSTAAFAVPIQAVGPASVTITQACGVSSFGFSGTIAHAVLSWKPAHVRPSRPTPLRSGKRVSFHWRRPDSLRSWPSSQERTDASSNAINALETSLIAENVLPCEAEVIIVGAGLAGLIFAATAINAGFNSLVLERSASVAGVWRHHANAFSRVNSSEPSYRLPIANRAASTNHSHHSEILTDALRLIQQHHLMHRVCIHKEVTRVAHSISSCGWLVSGELQKPFAVVCQQAILCTNRRLGRPREIRLHGEASFCGRIYRGLGSDVDTLRCDGERVVILGMGAFAIENMRTSLERHASHVTILCRQRGVACPQIVDWANFIRPSNEDVQHGRARDVIALAQWQHLYYESGAVLPECWRQGLLKPDGHTVSTSDMFFIAHDLRMLTTHCGEASRLDSVSVAISPAEKLESAVVIKCIGFGVNEGNERLLGRAHMRGTGQVEHGLWLQIEAHLDARAFSNPFGSSYINFAQFNAVSLTRHWRESKLARRIAHAALPRLRTNTLALGEALQAFDVTAALDPQIPTLLRRHVQSVSAKFHDTLSPKAYVAHNRKLWDTTRDLLMKRALISTIGSARLKYPFETFFDDLFSFASPAFSQFHDFTESTLEQVLLKVMHIVDAPNIDADMPLLDAGLDSLGILELRASLQAAVSMDLPATLVLEAPTARLISRVVKAPTRPKGTHECALLVGNRGRKDAKCLVGSAARLPSGAVGVNVASRIALSAQNVVGQVPAMRWIPSDSSITTTLNTQQQLGVRHGGFVASVHHFDSRIFCISSSEATVVDPQQRLLLEEGYEALHASSLRRDELLCSRVGIYVAMEYMDFDLLRFESQERPSALATNSGAMAAGRLSFTLGLNGPCMLIGTTCSSGLVAMSVATACLSSEDCGQTLVAAASLILRPFGHVWHASAGALSHRGRCHVFDRRADGFARSEAILAVMIEGRGATHTNLTVAGQAVCSDGRSATFTAPNGRAQCDLLAASLASADVKANALSCYEAHGTGTALGDPTEVSSVAAVLQCTPGVTPALAIGSFKGNVAHVEPGAGLAGLLMLCQALNVAHKPPNAQLRAVNPHVAAAVFGFYCEFCIQPLISLRSEVAIGGVSSFGINGTIAHAILRIASSSEHGRSWPIPMRWRRCAFVWLAVHATAIVPATTSAYYAIAWGATTVHLARVEPVWLLLSTIPALGADCTQNAMCSWRVVLLMCTALETSPSINAMNMLLYVVQRVRSSSVLFLSTGLHSHTSLTGLPTLTACAYGGCVGFGRVVRMESTSLQVRQVDLESAWGSVAFLGALKQSAHTEVHTARSSQLYAPTLRQSVRVLERFQSLRLSGEAIILGGLGGLGLHMGVWLLRSGISQVSLSSSSGRVVRGTQDLQQMMHSLLTGGARAVVRSCDSSKRMEVASLLETVPGANGIVHAPHVIKDGLVSSMRAVDIPSVFSAKAIGAANLHSVIVPLPPHFVLLLSSIATVGGVGIAAHSSANAFLDASAQSARAGSLKRRSLVIPIVLGVGAGAAIALSGASAEIREALGLSIERLLCFLHFSIMSTCTDTCGPLQSPAKLAATSGAFRPLLYELTGTVSTALTRNLTSRERIDAARAAAYALDSSIMLATARLPVCIEVVIVGGGLAGLANAKALKQANAEIVSACSSNAVHALNLHRLPCMTDLRSVPAVSGAFGGKATYWWCVASLWQSACSSQLHGT